MTSLRGLIILVVDDDEDVRDVLAEMLERAGAVVAAVASGRQVLALLETTAPNAIVAELLTPDGDGGCLLGQVRQRGLTIPVLALAGHLDARSRPALIRQGFADVILEPVGPADLVDAVALALRRPPLPAARADAHGEIPTREPVRQPARRTRARQPRRGR
jgi:DNA-binding NtrC family response regulator